MLTRRLIIDLGTIPNTAAIGRLADPPQLDGFLPFVLHQIACASVLTVTQERNNAPNFELTSLSRQTLTESTIVSCVERILRAGPGNVVTFNGRTFDLPLLEIRGLAHGCVTPALHALASTRGPRSTLGHIDLLDVLCPFAGAQKVRLADVCAALAIPSKADHEGTAAAARCNDKWDRIQHFCEIDAISTFLLDRTLDCRDSEDFRRLQNEWSALAEWISCDPVRFGHLSAFLDVPRAGFPSPDGIILGAGAADMVF